MDYSILNTIKKMLGLDAEYNAFDTDIIDFIKNALMTLHQYGATPKEGFAITGANETWSQCLPSDKMLEGAKTFIFLKVKMVFDPPQSSYVLNAYKEQATELEYRIKEQLEAYPGDISDVSEATQDAESSDDLYEPWEDWDDPWEDDSEPDGIGDGP